MKDDFIRDAFKVLVNDLHKFEAKLLTINEMERKNNENNKKEKYLVEIASKEYEMITSPHWDIIKRNLAFYVCHHKVSVEDIYLLENVRDFLMSISKYFVEKIVYEPNNEDEYMKNAREYIKRKNDKKLLEYWDHISKFKEEKDEKSSP